MVSWVLGTMGFSYKEWLGTFYPTGMASRNFLSYYSQRFEGVEVDATFYGPPTVRSIARWTAVTPPGFKFCLKTPRAITHEKRLSDAHEEMMSFLEIASGLNEKLGAVLLQLPPDFTYDYFTVLSDFLAALPKSYRYAVEFRHRSWITPGTAVLLERHNICWAAADYVHLPKKLRRTTDFLYFRFIGPHGRFTEKNREQIDKTQDLALWWRTIQPHLDQVETIFGFFNNDYAGYSPATCNRFREIVGLPPVDIQPWQQGRLL